jgi:hypothetical protein
MGDATWTIWGSFDNYNVTTFTRNLSTVVMNGNNKNLISNASTKGLYNLAVPESVTINIPTTSSTIYLYGTVTVAGTVNLSKSLSIYGTSADLQVASTGRITGSAGLTLSTSARISQQAGTIDTAAMYITQSHAAGHSIAPGIYSSPTVGIYCSENVAYSLVLSAGTYTFTGDVTITANDSYAKSYTVDNSAGANLVFKGYLVLANGALGTLNWTKGSGTITFAKASGIQTANFLDKSVEKIIVGDGTTTNTVALSAYGVTTSQVEVKAKATLDLNGQNLSYAAANGTYNDGTIKLQGNETLTNVSNLDTDSGTVVYKGNNTTSTYAIKDFGTTDYYNLSFTDEYTNKITLQVGANPLTMAGNLTLSSGSGTFDNATNNQNITVGNTSDIASGNVTMDNTAVNMGGNSATTGIWTVSGNFDNQDVVTFNRNSSALVMNGTGKTLISKDTNDLNALTISGTISIPTASDRVDAMGACTITTNKTLTIDSGETLYLDGANADLTNNTNGTITGAGTLTIGNDASIANQSGTINVTALLILDNHTVANPIASGTYDSQTVAIRNTAVAANQLVFSSGTTTIGHDIIFDNTNVAGTYTILNSTNNPNLIFKGNFALQQTAGTLNWAKGTGTLTFSKSSGTQTADFLGQTIEAIVVGDGTTTNVVQLTSHGVTTSQLTVKSNATLDLNGQPLSYISSNGTYNDGVIQLIGTETLTNIANLDTDSGTIEYTGTGTYTALPYTGTYYNLNFSGTGSFTLPNSLDVNGSLALNGSTVIASSNNLTLAGNFTHNTGTFTHHNGTVTLDGTAQAIAGDTVFHNLGKKTTASDTLTFAANSTTTVTNVLYLQGDAKHALSLRSSSKNTPWRLIHSGSPSLYTAIYLDVKDSHHTGGTNLTAQSSIDSGNNIGWNFLRYTFLDSIKGSTGNSSANGVYGEHTPLTPAKTAALAFSLPIWCLGLTWLVRSRQSLYRKLISKKIVALAIVVVSLGAAMSAAVLINNYRLRHTANNQAPPTPPLLSGEEGQEGKEISPQTSTLATGNQANGSSTAGMAATGASSPNATASATGIPFGPFDVTDYIVDAGSRGPFSGGYLGLNGYTSQDQRNLELLRAAGVSVFVTPSGASYQDAEDHFDLDMWKALVGRTVDRSGPGPYIDLNTYIASGTVIGYYMVDEPHDPTDWGGAPIPKADMDAAAAYVHELWPTLPAGVNGGSDGYVSGYNWQHMDWFMGQYTYSRGDAATWAANQIAAVRSAGLQPVLSLGILHGGRADGVYTPMSAEQIRTFGSAILAQSDLYYLLMWKYDNQNSYSFDPNWLNGTFNTPEYQAALAEVSAKAAAHVKKTLTVLHQ